MKFGQFVHPVTSLPYVALKTFMEICPLQGHFDEFRSLHNHSETACEVS